MTYSLEQFLNDKNKNTIQQKKNEGDLLFKNLDLIEKRTKNTLEAQKNKQEIGLKKAEMLSKHKGSKGTMGEGIQKGADVMAANPHQNWATGIISGLMRGFGTSMSTQEAQEKEEILRQTLNLYENSADEKQKQGIEQGLMWLDYSNKVKGYLDKVESQVEEEKNSLSTIGDYSMTPDQWKEMNAAGVATAYLTDAFKALGQNPSAVSVGNDGYTIFMRDQDGNAKSFSAEDYFSGETNDKVSIFMDKQKNLGNAKPPETGNGNVTSGLDAHQSDIKEEIAQRKNYMAMCLDSGLSLEEAKPIVENYMGQWRKDREKEKLQKFYTQSQINKNESDIDPEKQKRLEERKREGELSAEFGQRPADKSFSDVKREQEVKKFFSEKSIDQTFTLVPEFKQKLESAQTSYDSLSKMEQLIIKHPKICDARLIRRIIESAENDNVTWFKDFTRNLMNMGYTKEEIAAAEQFVKISNRLIRDDVTLIGGKNNVFMEKIIKLQNPNGHLSHKGALAIIRDEMKNRIKLYEEYGSMYNEGVKMLNENGFKMFSPITSTKKQENW